MKRPRRPITELQLYALMTALIVYVGAWAIFLEGDRDGTAVLLAVLALLIWQFTLSPGWRLDPLFDEPPDDPDDWMAE